jgi:hypothetical protein
LLLLSSLVFILPNVSLGETTTRTTTTITTTTTSSTTSDRISCPGPGCPGEYAYSLSVFFDKSEYYVGDIVHISGGIDTPFCTWTYAPPGGLAVTITISDPNGATIITDTTSPSAAGYKNYAYDYALSGSAVPGGYAHYTFSVLVSYSACGSLIYGSGTFQVSNPYWFAVSVDRTSYVCGDTVLATAVAQILLGSPAAVPGATVVFEIHTASGSVLATGSSATDPMGNARFQFALPSTCKIGTYVAYASTTIPKIGDQGNIALDARTNILVSQQPTRMHVIITLSTTDSNGNPKSAFTKGETVLVKVSVNNDGNFSFDNIHILLTIYDPNNVPIFYGISLVSLGAGQQQTQLLGMPLGSAVPAGTFKGEVVVLTAFLASGGHYVPDGSGAVTFVVT